MKAWPFGAALRWEASTHHMLRWLKSDVGKAHEMGLVGTGKTVPGFGDPCRLFVTQLDGTKRPRAFVKGFGATCRRGFWPPHSDVDATNWVWLAGCVPCWVIWA
jgi:hypothetical protein